MKRAHVLSLVIGAVMLVPTVTSAIGLPGAIVQCTGATGSHPCTCADLVQTAQNVLYTGIYLAVFLSAVLFAYAGWQMLTAHSTGDSGQITKAKDILKYVIYGLVIILAAWLIVNTLFTTLVSSKGFSNICP